MFFGDWLRTNFTPGPGCLISCWWRFRSSPAKAEYLSWKWWSAGPSDPEDCRASIMPAFVGFQHWVTNMWMYTMHHDTKIVPRFSLHSLGTSTPGAGIAFFWLCLNIFWGVRPKNLSKQSCDHLPTKIAKQNETAWFGD